jgi:protein-tyrosine phosphatase
MLQWECENAGINICLHKGCEYHVASWMIEDFSNGLWPTLAGTRYVLIEFDEDEDYLTLKGRIRSLHEAGFYPIVAHAERISCLAEKVERFSELNRMGARIQITAGAILGENGRQTANLCMGLIEKDYVQYVATDAHHTDNRKPNLGECFRFVSKQVGIMKARELMVFNPKKICGKEN